MITKHVCIVGGGVSGLVCAQTLKSLVPSMYRLNISIIEATDRLGGQIDTQKHTLCGGQQAVIIEAGAEGFVSRSTIFPRVAAFAGLDDSEMVSQNRIGDSEVRKEERGWIIHPLEPGIAEKKLGFQVSKEDRGRGIRSFRTGMSTLVE